MSVPFGLKFVLLFCIVVYTTQASEDQKDVSFEEQLVKANRKLEIAEIELEELKHKQEEIEKPLVEELEKAKKKKEDVRKDYDDVTARWKEADAEIGKQQAQINEIKEKLNEYSSDKLIDSKHKANQMLKTCADLFKLLGGEFQIDPIKDGDHWQIHYRLPNTREFKTSTKNLGATYGHYKRDYLDKLEPFIPELDEYTVKKANNLDADMRALKILLSDAGAKIKNTQQKLDNLQEEHERERFIEEEKIQILENKKETIQRKMRQKYKRKMKLLEAREKKVRGVIENQQQNTIFDLKAEQMQQEKKIQDNREWVLLNQEIEELFQEAEPLILQSREIQADNVDDDVIEKLTPAWRRIMRTLQELIERARYVKGVEAEWYVILAQALENRIKEERNRLFKIKRRQK